MHKKTLGFTPALFQSPFTWSDSLNSLDEDDFAMREATRTFLAASINFVGMGFMFYAGFVAIFYMVNGPLVGILWQYRLGPSRLVSL